MLKGARCALDVVVDLTLFFIDAEASVALVLNAIKEHFARAEADVTAVGVTWLAGFQFEIKVIARIPHT